MRLTLDRPINVILSLASCLLLAAGCTMPDPISSDKVQLTVTVKGDGKVLRDNGTAIDNTTTFTIGTKLILTADNTTDVSVFDHWEGANTGTNPRTLIILNDNATLTAVFKPRQQTLTVKTTGQGTVSPSGGTYSYGDNVTLTAAPADGWQFARWSDNASGTAPQITVTMTNNLTVTAVFDQIAPQYPLAITIQGQGSVTPDNATYDAGTVVTLTATPDPAWELSSWQGDATGSDNSTSIQITMNGSKSITAVFVQQAAPKVLLDTTLGKILIELDRTKAPITVDNFVQYVLDGFYDGRDGQGRTIFHRIIPSFMNQGGGYLDNLTAKTNLRPAIVNESTNGLSNTQYSVAMARSDNPDSATSQFFINTADNSGQLDRGANPSNPAGYAVFGHVISGMDVVDNMSQVPTKWGPLDAQNASLPETTIYINSAEVMSK